MKNKKSNLTVVLNDDVGFKFQYAIQDNIWVYLKVKVSKNQHSNAFPWVGIGLSEAGHMLGADIVSLTFKDNKPEAIDWFVPWNAYPNISPIPTKDKCNDWELICATQESNQLEYFVKRLINTHDTQDREIKKGVSFVIFAWGEGKELSYHGSNSQARF